MSLMGRKVLFVGKIVEESKDNFGKLDDSPTGLIRIKFSDTMCPSVWVPRSAISSQSKSRRPHGH